MLFILCLTLVLFANAEKGSSCDSTIRKAQIVSHSKDVLEKCIKKELPSDVCVDIYSKQAFSPKVYCEHREGDVLCNLCNNVADKLINAAESNMALDKVHELMNNLCIKFRRELPQHYCYFVLDELYFKILQYLESGNRSDQFCEWAKMCPSSN
ncbi:hypothetical protein EDI_264410 [Entamoeba dispar SAW760]|uniref:Saposin B-type domain-containing protein n=1 Tax=Entamoeba dispar (strain ATCC PRA-260 / SAW760) TaxID=370354 RepID=B0ELF6_ENTDS|nr:uncharacterized protein EDI_264410 [Entamoeba dispar SAW760]EDR24646.1 hypothetical protein EDI_264410 [Entamoeba dispar SAW760]|eukprot:EDR24646.1 hypothetical protein EDI_264410 [Entamoeba dispar SAW760]